MDKFTQFRLAAILILSFALTLFTQAADQVVTNNANSGAGSFRQAITDVTAGGTITFNLSAGNETITIASELVIIKAMTINGANTSGSGTQVTVQVTTPGTSAWRVFEISASGSTINLQNMSLKGGDMSIDYGGSIQINAGATVNLTGMIISGSKAYDGGGINIASSWSDRSVVTVTSSTFNGNSANHRGGGICISYYVNITINACEFTNNSGNGGAILNGGVVTITKSTFNGNSGWVGGTIYNFNSSTATIVSSTISGNSSGWYAGGIYSEGTCYLLNSILINNTGTAGRDISVGSGSTYAYYCWYNSTYGTINTQAGAPNVTTSYSSGYLGALANNGGPTQTMAVTATSPALNNGAFAYYNVTDGYYFLDNQAIPVSHKLADWATSPSIIPTDKITTDQRGSIILGSPAIGAYNPDPPAVVVTATAGTTTGGYATLREAFNAINAGTHQGTVTVMINNSTTETASAVLNASGSGSALYTSVNIYPTVTGLSISGNLAAALIDLNGADNVTIDGRVNATGSAKDLVITNTSTSAAAGVSTIRFINDACSNTVKYCVIKGSELASVSWSGILFFSTAGSNNGNDNNRIDHNDITCASDVNRPQNAVCSLGTAGKENDGNTISNDNIFDFFSRSVATCGIYLDNNNSAWTISGCSFYEQNAFAPSSSQSFSVVKINSPTGNNFNITGNYIGGSAALCSGTFTKINSGNNTFYGIIVITGPGTASNIQGNTIRNFNYANSSSASWSGISVREGTVNIGTVTTNTIGAATGNGSVILTNTTSEGSFTGIDVAGTCTTNTQNNTIGSITTANINAANATNFCGIKTSSTGTITICNNTIGSQTTTGSINLSSPSATGDQIAIGILNEGPGSLTISGNLIANMTNGITSSDPNNRGLIHGILTLDGSNTISGNTIRDLRIANANTAADYMAPVIGIGLIYTTDAAQSITGNTIYNLSNTFASFAGNVIGLYYNGSTTASTVSGNFIHSLSVTGATSAAASIYGIKIISGTTTYANNIITLGGNTKTNIYGINETGTSANNNNLYYNTVYLGGTLASGSTNTSCALYSAVTTNIRNFRNNILCNARSTTGGASLHYAAWFNYASSSGLTLDYNDYYASGTGGVLGYYNTADVTSLPLISGQDASSKSVDPGFASAGGSSASNYLPSNSTLVAVMGTGISTDYAGTPRSLTSPSMGAWEYTVTPCIPSITSQSTDAQTQCIGGTFNPISVTATGANLNYQWYSKPDQITSGGTAVGINSNTYTPLATTAGTLYYYCFVTNTCGTATSAISGAFVVNPLPAPTIYSAGGTSICQGNSVTLNVSGNALQFGSNSSVEINDNPILRFTSAESYTVMAWVYVQSNTYTWRGIVTKSRDQGSFYGIWIDPGNQWVYGTGTLPSDFNNITGSIVTTGWHHIAIVQTGSVDRNLFVDGVSVGTGTVHNSDGTGLLRFGRSGNNFEVFEGGILDEVSIFNTNLSSSTINTWKNVSITSAHPNYANLVGYWKLDEGTGTTTADASGHGLTGALVNSPVWVATSAPVNQYSSYLWSPGSATTSTLNVTTSGTYSVYVTDANACSNTTAGVTVTVNPLPLPTISGSTTACTNSTGNVYTTQAGMTAYSWSIAGGTITLGGTATDNSATVTWTTSGAESISVNYTNGNGCTATTATGYNVTVDPVSVGGSIAGGATVCSGTNSTMLTLSGHTGSVVKWQKSTDNWTTPVDVANTTTTMIATDLTATTKYRAVVQSGVCSLINSSDATITVNPNGQVDQPVNQLVCNATSTSAVTFSTTNIGGTTTYSWTNDTPGIGLTSSGTGNISVFTALNTGTAPVVANLAVTPTYTSGGTSCIGSAKTFKITVNPSGQVNQPASQLVCNNAGTAAVVFETTNTGGTTTFVWTNDSPGIGLPASGSGNIASFTATNNGTAPVVATIIVTPTFTNGSASCAGLAKTFTITVNPTGQVIQPVDQVVCNAASTSVNFATLNTGGTATYAWTNNNPGIGLPPSGTGNISFNAINTGISPVTVTFTVTPTFTNGAAGCSGPTKTFTIIVNPTGQVNQPSSQVLCHNSSTSAINFSTVNTDGNTVYAWTNSAPSIGLDAFGTGNIPSFTAINAGTTPVVATIVVTPTFTNGSAGCAGPPRTFTITVNPLPVTTITGNASLCVNSGYYDYTTEAGMTNYEWTVSSGGTITWGAGSNHIQVIWTTAGAQSVTLAYTNPNGCGTAVPKVLPVTVNPLPDNAGAISGQASVCSGESGAPYSVGSIAGAISYTWTLPSGATITSGAGTRSIIIQFGSASGNITVAGINTCGQGTSSPALAVTVNPIPQTPVITASGSVLASSAPGGNQWYHNGAAISGATGQTYTVPANKPGWYWTEVTLLGCASDTSNHLYIRGVGIDENNAGSFNIYPVPSNGRFNVAISWPSPALFNIAIYNELGSMIYQKTDIRVIGTTTELIELRSTPPGVYTVVFTSSDCRVIRKIIISD
ncbi:MAG: LamG-like jellyroll fold domain-containing protein [Bacteroidota bacterium]